MLKIALGAAFGLLLTGVSLLVLPFAFAHAGFYRLHRASLQESQPIDAVEPLTILRIMAEDRRISPWARSLIALEQVRIGDVDSAEMTLDIAEADAERLAAAGRDMHGDFQRKKIAEARQRSLRSDLPAVFDYERQAAVGRRMRLAAPSSVIRAAEQGDFERAIKLALGAKIDAIALQPASSLALIAFYQSERDDKAAIRTLSLARQVAMKMSNWWPVGSDSGYRDRALSLVAVTQAQVGDIDGALETFSDVIAQGTGDLLAQELAASFAVQGHREEALTMLWSIVDHDQRAQASIDVVQVWYDVEIE